MTKRERPEVLTGTTRKIKTGCGSLYVTCNVDENGHPIEVFCKLGKTGGCAASQLEAMGRLISIGLRSGYGLEDMVKQLTGISCHQPSGFGPALVRSCSDGVAKILSLYLETK
jgi:ribonucleoside-diphosphate reductase alpha chain